MAAFLPVPQQSVALQVGEQTAAFLLPFMATWVMLVSLSWTQSFCFSRVVLMLSTFLQPLVLLWKGKTKKTNKNLCFAWQLLCSLAWHVLDESSCSWDTPKTCGQCWVSALGKSGFAPSWVFCLVSVSFDLLSLGKYKISHLVVKFAVNSEEWASVNGRWAKDMQNNPLPMSDLFLRISYSHMLIIGSWFSHHHFIVPGVKRKCFVHSVLTRNVATAGPCGCLLQYPASGTQLWHCRGKKEEIMWWTVWSSATVSFGITGIL